MVLLFSLFLVIIETILHREAALVQTNAAIINIYRNISVQHGINPAATQYPLKAITNVADRADKDFTRAAEKTERGLIERSNKAAYMTMVYAGLVIMSLLYMIYMFLKYDARVNHQVQIFGSPFATLFLNSVLCIVLFTFFQVYFFSFARKYRYMGFEEQMLLLNNNLAAGLECPKPK